eukprot:scaffold1019_cov277-Chaetoceros_neogracile.AAC.18
MSMVFTFSLQAGKITLLNLCTSCELALSLEQFGRMVSSTKGSNAGKGSSGRAEALLVEQGFDDSAAGLGSISMGSENFHDVNRLNNRRHH